MQQIEPFLTTYGRTGHPSSLHITRSVTRVGNRSRIMGKSQSEPTRKGVKITTFWGGYVSLGTCICDFIFADEFNSDFEQIQPSSYFTPSHVELVAEL